MEFHQKSEFVDILDYGLCERLGRLLNRYRQAEVI
jgi:hypothetical protein